MCVCIRFTQLNSLDYDYLYHSRPDIHMHVGASVVRMVMQIATLLLFVVSTIDILFMAGVYAAWSFAHECTVAWLYAGREDVN